jgi:hypothetical protein
MMFPRDVEGRSLRIENLVLRGLLLVLGLGAFAAGREARAKDVPFTIEAHEFVLLDRRGERQAVLGLDPTGEPELVFFRPDGKRGMVISDKWQLKPAR